MNGIITLEKQWALRPVPFAYQMLVKDITVHDSTFQQFKTLDEVYPTNSQCFMLGSPNYGCQGNVMEIENGRVRVVLTVPVEPNLNHVKNSQDVSLSQVLFLATGLNFMELLIKQKLLLNNFLLSRNEQDTSYKSYMLHGILTGNLTLVSIILWCLAPFCG